MKISKYKKIGSLFFKNDRLALGDSAYIDKDFFKEEKVEKQKYLTDSNVPRIPVEGDFEVFVRYIIRELEGGNERTDILDIRLTKAGAEQQYVPYLHQSLSYPFSTVSRLCFDTTTLLISTEENILKYWLKDKKYENLKNERTFEFSYCGSSNAPYYNQNRYNFSELKNFNRIVGYSFIIPPDENSAEIYERYEEDGKYIEEVIVMFNLIEGCKCEKCNIDY